MQGLAMFDLEWRNIEAGQSWAASQALESNAIAELCDDYPDVGRRVILLRLPPHDRISWREDALIAARKLKRRNSEGWHLGNIGIAYLQLGEVRRAIEFHDQALNIHREMNDRYNEGLTLNNLGMAYADLGETRRAIEYYEQSLMFKRSVGSKRDESSTIGNLGLAYADLGETRRAVEYHEQHLAIAREIGDRRGEGTALFNMSLALDKLGDRTQAILNATAALKIFEQIESPSADIVRNALAELREQE